MSLTDSTQLLAFTADDEVTVPGGAGRAVWCLVTLYGTWNSASVTLQQNNVDVTDWASITADQTKVTCLASGPLEVDVTGSPTSLNIKVQPIVNE